MRLSLPTLLTCALAPNILGACAAEEETPAPALNGPELAVNADAANSALANDMELGDTGWLVVGEEGEIYTTQLDADGTYRDFSNGEFFQSGQWARREDGRLCFAPRDANRFGACWSLGVLDNMGTMRAQHGDGRMIAVRRVTYISPTAQAEAEATARAAEKARSEGQNEPDDADTGAGS